jgi:hypothetical protein
MSNKVNLTCDEATTICDKTQYSEASLLDKIKLRFHSLICKHCRTYSYQNNILSKLLGKHLNLCDEKDQLTKEDKKELEKNLIEKDKK